MEEWKNGIMERWNNGMMERWNDGIMERFYHGGTKNTEMEICDPRQLSGGK